MKVNIRTPDPKRPLDIRLTDEDGRTIEGVEEVIVTIRPPLVAAEVRFREVEMELKDVQASFDRNQIRRIAEACGFEVRDARPWLDGKPRM